MCVSEVDLSWELGVGRQDIAHVEVSELLEGEVAAVVIGADAQEPGTSALPTVDFGLRRVSEFLARVALDS